MRASPIVFVSLTVALGACASAPPPELNSARSAYNRVSNGPAAQLVPADVDAAKKQLAVADKSFDDHGDSQGTRDLAYAAERKADLADVRAQMAADRQQQESAQVQLQALKDQQVKTTSAELSTTRQQLAAAEQDKAEADRRAQQAAADLARIASVKQDQRGLVITLSGGVLFASAKSDLLPEAQVKLGEVADVLSKQDKESKILVQGYTDSQGALSFNQDLSQRRADTVRNYLVSHGIASDRITAQGLGPSNPVVDNSTAEGRANNRRVEIILQQKSGAMTTDQ
jgi:outer membrane protein OmpA-like peptidoglycan-associated protein